MFKWHSEQMMKIEGSQRTQEILQGACVGSVSYSG